MVILICGFSGAGKSTLLKKLQASAPKSTVCADLDDLVEFFLNQQTKVPKKLGEHIQLLGMEKFRKMEKMALDNFIKNNPDAILALGGGTLNDENILKLKNVATILFLDVPFEICWSRIKSDANRPLVAQGMEVMQKLFNDRRKVFKFSHASISADIKYEEMIELAGEL
jgi:shikimate kinase